MSLFYTLEINTVRSPEQVLNLLATSAGLKQSDAAHLHGEGVFIGANLFDLEYQEEFANDYRLSPTVTILFEISDTADDYVAGMRSMMSSIVAILSADSTEDLVLLFNGENIVLRRVGGALILNETWGNWKNYLQLINLISLPFNWEKMKA